MNQSRKSKGQPTGGQFAAKSNPESDTELEDSASAGGLGSAPAEADDEVWSWGAMYDILGHEEANSLFDESGGSLGKAIAIAVRREADRASAAANLPNAWHAAGITDPAAIARMQEHGLAPADLTSPDRDTRMAAHSAAMHLIFEGELLSNALQLYRHAPGIDQHRTFHAPASVYVGGVERPWSSLSAEDQVAYISGYARAIAHGGDRDHLPPNREEAAAAGYVHGQSALSAAAMIEAHPGEDRGYAIVHADAPGRRLVVTNPRFVPERGGYVASVGSGQHRRHFDDDGSRTVPFSPGATVFFTVDALGIS